MRHYPYFTFGWHTEGILDLGEVEDHGQLVYLSTVGQVIGRHDRRDAQLSLQDAIGQLDVVHSTGLIQGGHVTAIELEGRHHYTVFFYSKCYQYTICGVDQLLRFQIQHHSEIYFIDIKHIFKKAVRNADFQQIQFGLGMTFYRGKRQRKLNIQRFMLYLVNHLF